MASTLDILDDDIPVVDGIGGKRLVQGAAFVDPEATPPSVDLPAPQLTDMEKTLAEPTFVPAPLIKHAPPINIATEPPPTPAPSTVTAPVPIQVNAAPSSVADESSAASTQPEPPSNLPFLAEVPAYAKKSKALSAVMNEAVVPSAATPASTAVAQQPAPAAKSEPAPVPASPFAAVVPPPTQQAKPAPAASRADLGLEPERDTSDIAKIAEQPGVQQLEAEQKKEMTLLERKVEEATAATGEAIRDEDMRRRYGMLISLYFRGLRDALETKSKFTMPVGSGGMGFKDDEAEKIMAELTRRNLDYHDALRSEAAESKSQYVAARTEKVLNLQEETDKREQEKGDRAYRDLLERVGMRGEEPFPPKPAAPPVAIPVVAANNGTQRPGANVAVKEPAVVSAVNVTPAAPPQPPPSLHMAATRPLVSDVSYAPKLIGPVEELRSLTLKDFRRLSKEPKEAALKIKDKIDLLEEQSFTLKTQGVEAWQGSEVNRLYLDVLRRSLEGRPVGEVIADMTASGGPAITQAEFEAVMDLNRKLRFG